MSLDWEEIDGIGIAHPEGPELGADAAEEFRHAIAPHQEAVDWIVIDLEDISFMDSSGLGAIVSVLKAVRGRGEVRLCGVSHQVEALFRLTGLLKVLPIEPSRALAIRSLQEARSGRKAA